MLKKAHGRGCMYCGEMFLNADYLVQHFLTIHADKKVTSFEEFSHKCMFCSKVYKTSHSLQKHINNNHQTKLKI